MGDVTASTSSTCGGEFNVDQSQQSSCLCNSFDSSTWNAPNDDQQCCSDAGNCPCCRIQPETCPTLALSTGNTPPSAPPSLPNAQNCAFEPTCPVQCKYPIEAFQTTADVQAYINAFGTDNGWSNQLMPVWCNNVVRGTCPTDPKTNMPMPSCSRMSSTAEDGILCQNWITANPAVSDVIIRNYCDRNNTPDCACVLRRLNPIYSDLTAMNPYNAGCWWKDCTSGATYLRTSDVRDPITGCPTEVCQIIQNVINSTDVNFNDVVDQISGCPGLMPRPTPSPSPSPVSGTWLFVPLGLVVLALLGVWLLYRSL